jgi:hypothetical protein
MYRISHPVLEATGSIEKGGIFQIAHNNSIVMPVKTGIFAG